MKRFAFLAMAVLAAAALSCKKEEGPGKGTGNLDSDTSIKNISAYAPNTERGQDVLEISYGEGNSIILTTPAVSAAAAPVDITNVVLEVEVAEKAKTNITGPLDFEAAPAQTLVITAENGDKAEWALSVVVTPAYEVLPEFETTFTTVWEKTGATMNMICPDTAKDIAVYGDYFLILDNNVDMIKDADTGGNGAKIRAYNKLTGEFVANVTPYEGGWVNPRSYMWSLCADEGGNFAMGRLNSGGAGCEVDVYGGLEGPLSHLFHLGINAGAITAGDYADCLGKRMQVLGDLKQGKGMIIMTTANFYGVGSILGSYGTWELEDGVAKSLVPSMTTLAYTWCHAIVQRKSLEDPTMYIAYSDENYSAELPKDEWASQHAANFEINVPGETPVAVKTECFDYRILDMEVFELLGGRFMASLQQTYSKAGVQSVQVYDFTDVEKMKTMTPDTPGFDKFRLCKNEASARTNDCLYGNVAVYVDETANCAYIYSFIPGGNILDVETGAVTGKADAKITCTKMEVRRTN